MKDDLLKKLLLETNTFKNEIQLLKEEQAKIRRIVFETNELLKHLAEQ